VAWLLAILILFTAPPARAFADGVPKLNVTPSCRAITESPGLDADFNSCLQSENKARDQLEKEWNSFVASDRALCRRTATMGGVPSYTELLTCLEMARDARNLPPQSQASDALNGIAVTSSTKPRL
jgi:hypothetical protein